MKFLDSNGVRKLKEYVDNKFVTAEEFSVIEGVERDTYTKQEIDTMLAEIEEGGADLTNYYTKTESDNRYATSSQIPTKTSQLTNNSGFITSETDPVFAASAAAGITSSDITNWNNKTSNTGTVTQVKVGTTTYNPSSGVVSLPAYPTTLPASDVSAWAKASTKPTYTASEVGAATQSDINTAISDLIGTAPETLNTLGEIADALNDDANLAATLTAQIGAKYTKPSTGIPKSDLASAVQTSLGKADTALQSETDPVFSASAAAGITSSDITNWNNKTSNTGTLTGVTFNGTNATVTNGVAAITANIPAAANNSTITIQKGGTSVDSFTVNASSNKTINIPNELPSFTNSNNGQILMVVNGALSWVNPSVIYSGSSTPNNANGNNGDVYLQE